MRPLSVFCTLSVLLLLFDQFASTIDAIKDLEEYWRTVMKGQPMPESVQDLLAVDPATSTTDEDADEKSNPLIFSDNVQPSQVKSFSKNFNSRPNLLVYQSYHNSHNDPPSEMNFNSITNFPQHDPDNSHNNQPSEVRSFSKNFNTRPNLLFYHSYHNSHNDPPFEVKSFDKDVLKPDK